MLLLTGQNNHNLVKTTEILKTMLEENDKFRVDITKTPETMTAEQLKKYQLILSNWNSFGAHAKVKDWSAEAKTAFVDFVKNGGGVVIYHAGGSSFPEWKEFHQIIGATWKIGQTGHDKGIMTTMFPTGDHPITRGIKPYQSDEELWFKMGVNSEFTVLMEAYCKTSDRKEPVAFILDYGKGRCFNLVLGHLPEDMTRFPAFKTLLVRGSEWAATGKVSE